MALDSERIESIPSMGGDKAAGLLYWWACCKAYEMADDGLRCAVVECGAWLGAGTVAIACALRDHDEWADAAGLPRCSADLVVHDKWSATLHECHKAAAAGVSLEAGQDLTPIFLANVEDIYPLVVPVRGDTRRATWDQGVPIYMYVDDCNKRPEAWSHAMRTFKPAFVPGKTVCVFMDIDFYTKFEGEERAQLACQHEYVAARPHEFTEITDIPGTTGRAYTYTGG